MQINYPNEKPKKKKKSIFKRLLLWVLIIFAAVTLYNRYDLRSKIAALRQTISTSTSTVSTPKPTAKPIADPTAAPSKAPTAAPTVAPTAAPAVVPAETDTPGSPALAETDIRPEVKEFLEAYEACMNEYVDFMQKYTNADPVSMISMAADYYRILARYTEFSEKLDAYDESELTNAELAYYLEVTNRVNQKLLSVSE